MGLSSVSQFTDVRLKENVPSDVFFAANWTVEASDLADSAVMLWYADAWEMIKGVRKHGYPEDKIQQFRRCERMQIIANFMRELPLDEMAFKRGVTFHTMHFICRCTKICITLLILQFCFRTSPKNPEKKRRTNVEGEILKNITRVSWYNNSIFHCTTDPVLLFYLTKLMINNNRSIYFHSFCCVAYFFSYFTNKHLL